MGGARECLTRDLKNVIINISASNVKYIFLIVVWGFIESQFIESGFCHVYTADTRRFRLDDTNINYKVESNPAVIHILFTETHVLPYQSFHAKVQGLRIEGVICCTDCKAP